MDDGEEEEITIMNAMMTLLRRNNKIFLGILILGAIFYYFLWPRDTRNRRIARRKETHPVSFYLRDVAANDTLFNAIMEQEFVHPESKQALANYLRPEKNPPPPFTFQNSLLNVDSGFNIDDDVIVYLHIQKVGGTIFNHHLMKDLQLESPCKCEKDMMTNPCHCKNKKGNIWLFSWFSVGWPCELHADWTMLHECVDGALNKIEGKTRPRRYFYITLLRDPISRYLSEWKHHRIGQHWKDGKLRCNGERVTFFDVRPCFNERTWIDVSFAEFMECRDNLATNRQTRMVADLTKSKCYQRTRLGEAEQSKLRLESALENIGSIAFFGLTDHQKETKILFEKTFGLRFMKDFQTLDEDDGNELIARDEFIKMMQYIELDVQLYHYAKELFLARMKEISR